MEIFGHEYGFMLTVGASAEVAELCPGGDLTRISEALDGRFADTVEVTARFVVAMAGGYDASRLYAGEPVEHPPLTVNMLKALSFAKFQEVQRAAMASFRGDTTPSVEVEPSKKKETLSE